MNHQKQDGLTLIEMMIALLLATIVMGTILTIFISNVKSSSENIKMIHLNQELRTIITFIADDLKRAGYSADPTSTDFINEYNPDIADCILYSYDADEDGVRDADERFGFKLANNAIEWTQNRTALNCTSGTWSQLSNPAANQITAFNITPTSINTASASILIENVEIEIVGQVDLNPGTGIRRIRETVRVRNEDAN